MSEYRELLIGCGNSRVRKIRGENDPEEFRNLTTLDIDPNCGADIIFDLERLGKGWETSFDWNTFDEIHAYDVLEHLGRQGDWKAFFNEFSEFWRILKPDGRLIARTPALDSPWAWGDPGHTRVIGIPQLTFLMQPEYTKQVGVTSITDYRHYYRADFEAEYAKNIDPDTFDFVLRAVKPSRISV